jgi:UDP-N-acetyl-L-fucosamine synthase
LSYFRPGIDKSAILKKLSLEKGKYLLFSFHREENIDNPANLEKILQVLNRLADIHKLPIIVSTHPRTQKRLDKSNGIKISERVSFLKAFGFFDYVKLQENALCVVSDSGTISEESAILSFPAISLRQSMERPEAQDAGTIILSGLDPDVVTDSVSLVIREHQSRVYESIPVEYKIPDTSWRVLKLIMGNTKLSNIWNGINK